MVSDALLAILRCPEDHSELTRAAPSLVLEINRCIAAREVQSRAGRPLERPIDEGLVRKRRDVLYPVVEGIPRLLIEEGILLSQFSSSDAQGAPS